MLGVFLLDDSESLRQIGLHDIFIATGKDKIRWTVHVARRTGNRHASFINEW